ncbi:MAG: GNAT family N-acetyltransferase [Armatimonadetes bacterium]|nr:GNAT family N-acetyltransferase [Armatimonadota bacterium]
MPFEISACRPEELPALLDLADRVFRSRRSGAMEKEYPLLFHPDNLEQLRVIRAQGRPVSHVGVCLREGVILGCRMGVASIGSVATAPDYRGGGMASALMEDARRHSLERGVSLMLISGGRGLYHRLGYVPAGRFASLVAPAGTAPMTSGQPRPCAAGDILTVVGFHQREPVRYIRSLDDWRRLLNAGNLMNHPADLWIIEDGGVPVGYVATQQPSSGPGPRSPVRAYEFAGARRAVAEALPTLAAHYGAEEIEIVTQPDDAALLAEARRRDWRIGARGFPGTLGIIDGPAFFAALHPYLEERWGRDLGGLELEPLPEGAIFRRAGAEYRLETRGLLTTLVFGGDVETARALPPPPAPVAEALRAAFPMPLLWYGYNYV